MGEYVVLGSVAGWQKGRCKARAMEKHQDLQDHEYEPFTLHRTCDRLYGWETRRRPVSQYAHAPRRVKYERALCVYAHRRV